LRALDAQQPEVRSGGGRARRQMHQRRVCNVAVGKDNHVNALVANDLLHPVLIKNRDAIWIQLARQLRGITAAINVGNLCGGESYDVKFGIISENYVEVVKVAASGSQDQHRFHSASKASLDP